MLAASMKAKTLLAMCALVVALASGAEAASREGLLAQGEQWLLKGSPLLAEVAFLQGMSSFPDDARFPYYAGVAAYVQGRERDAEKRFRDAVPAVPEAYFFLALLALEAGDVPAAGAAIDAYLKAKPRDAAGELLKGIVAFESGNPKAVDHLNLAAQLDRSLISYALFFRGLSEFQTAGVKADDKALRAVLRLGEQPRLMALAEQVMDVMQNRGEVAKTRWIEVFVDTIYDDNLNRELNQGNRIDGFRSVLRARYWETFRSDAPTLTAGVWLAHDQPFVSEVTARTALGLIGDMGGYYNFAAAAIDPGIEIEPSLVLGPPDGGYGLDEVDIAVRPRLYVFSDHERSVKMFYELGYLADVGRGFRSGLRHRLGLRPTWTGPNRRTYFSGLVALHAIDADARANRWIGPEIALDMQAKLLSGLLLELNAGLVKAFYREVRPVRNEDVLTVHGGLGYAHPSGFVMLAGVDQEHHLNSESARNWRVYSYWLRLGGYF